MFEGELFHLKCLFPLLFPLPICVCVYVISSLIDAQPSPPRKLFSVFPNQMKQSNLLFLFLLHFKSNLPCFLLHNHNNTRVSKQMYFYINKNLFGIFQKLLGKNSGFGFHYGQRRLFLVPTQTYLFLLIAQTNVSIYYIHMQICVSRVPYIVYTYRAQETEASTAGAFSSTK